MVYRFVYILYKFSLPSLHATNCIYYGSCSKSNVISLFYNVVFERL